MNAKLQPRSGDAFIVIVTDDAGKRHHVHYWPDDSDPKGDHAEAKAIQYIQQMAKPHG